MTVKVKNIIPAKAMEIAQTTQYTVSALNVIIDKVTLTNTGAADATVSINLVESGGSVADSNTILDSKIITPGETFTANEVIGHYLGKGAFISTIADVGTVTIMASGRVIT